MNYIREIISEVLFLYVRIKCLSIREVSASLLWPGPQGPVIFLYRLFFSVILCNVYE